MITVGYSVENIWCIDETICGDNFAAD
jgi:hypothetical protein